MARLEKAPKVGEVVIVEANTNSHNYTIGERYRITHVKSGTMTAVSLDGSWTGNNLRWTDCELAPITKEQFQSRIQELNTSLAELQRTIEYNQSVVEWMDENGLEEYDETQYKVWQTLTTIENSSLSKMEKVKAIAALLN